MKISWRKFEQAGSAFNTMEKFHSSRWIYLGGHDDTRPRTLMAQFNNTPLFIAPDGQVS